jgi:hypothetical protein
MVCYDQRMSVSIGCEANRIQSGDNTYLASLLSYLTMPRYGLCAALSISLAASAASAQPRRPEVLLNHVYVTLDSVTLAAAETSSFLVKEFSHHRKETNRTTDGRSWTGVNLFGEQTYVELFPRGQRGLVQANDRHLRLPVPLTTSISCMTFSRPTSDLFLTTSAELFQHMRCGV